MAVAEQYLWSLQVFDFAGSVFEKEQANSGSSAAKQDGVRQARSECGFLVPGTANCAGNDFHMGYAQKNRGLAPTAGCILSALSSEMAGSWFSCFLELQAKPFERALRSRCCLSTD